MTSMLSCLVATLALGADPALQGLPFGIPPAPEDAVIASVAPPHCLAYVNWAGTAAPDPASKSETEKMLAEPEVQGFLNGLNKVIASSLRKQDEAAKKPAGKGGSPPGAALSPAVPRPEFSLSAEDTGDAVRELLTHPAAYFVEDVKLPAPKMATAADKPADKARAGEKAIAAKPDTKSTDADGSSNPEIQAGMVVSLGPDAPRLRAKLLAMLKQAPSFGPDTKLEQIKIAGETWFRITPTTPGNKNVTTFGFNASYFVCGMGDGVVECILARWHRPAPAWLTKAMEQTEVPRRTGIVYLNVKAIREKLLSLAESKQRAAAAAACQVLGVDNLDTLISTTGLEDSGFVNRVLVTIDGKPRGLLDVLSARPLAANDLAPIPADALVAIAARIDFYRCFDVFLTANKKACEAANPDSQKEIKKAMNEALDGLMTVCGIDLRRALSSVGDTWCLYNSPGQGEFALCGWTLVVPVRDRAFLQGVCEKLLAAQKANPKQTDGVGRVLFPIDLSAELRKCSFAAHDVYYLAAGMISPAGCVTGRELVITLNMPAMKAYLSRKTRHSLATVASVKSVLNAPNRPTAIIYCNAPRLFDYLYPLCSVYVNLGSTAAQQAGIDLDPTFWPSAPAIRAHLRPEIAMLRRAPQGIELTCRYSLPTGGADLPLMYVIGPTLAASAFSGGFSFGPSTPPSQTVAPPPTVTIPKAEQSSAPVGTPPKAAAAEQSSKSDMTPAVAMAVNRKDGPRQATVTLPDGKTPALTEPKPATLREPDGVFWSGGHSRQPQVLEPIAPHSTDAGMAPPSEDELMHSLERARPVKNSAQCTVERRKVHFVSEVIQDSIDPPRIMPLVGPVQVHRVHWKCTVYFTELTHTNGPTPKTAVAENCKEVIYIDRDHVHRVGKAVVVAAPSAAAPAE